MPDFAKIDVEISESEKEMVVNNLLRQVVHPASLSIMEDLPEMEFKEKVYEVLVNEGILRLLQREVERMAISEKI